VRPARLERATSWFVAVDTLVDPAQLTNPGARFGAATWTQSWTQDFSPSTGVSPAQVAHLLTRICPLTRSRPVIWWLRSFFFAQSPPAAARSCAGFRWSTESTCLCGSCNATLTFGHATPPPAAGRPQSYPVGGERFVARWRRRYTMWPPRLPETTRHDSSAWERTCRKRVGSSGLMYLYLVHHGDAVAPEVDPARPLSTQGLEAANRLAAEAAARAAKPAVVWHSGKLRARQTAEAFWSACNPRAEFAAARDLSPDDPPSSLRDRLRGETRDILIAGHFPQLPRLLTLLLGGAADAPAAFPLHGVVALESLDEGETWVERWRLSPAS
jgi:phosphohistidine phosphatase